MPIDPSISLGYKGIDMPNPLNQMAQVSQIQASQRQGQAAQMQLDELKNILQANELSYGKRSIPSYHFDQAKVIVSLGADFLSSWVSPVEFAKQYANGRRIDEKNPTMIFQATYYNHEIKTSSNLKQIVHKNKGIRLLNAFIIRGCGDTNTD
jgi:hypothetical protein